MDANKTIWEGFKEYKKLAYVVRTGFGYCGIYPINPDELKPKKGRKPLPESDLEHIAGMQMLIRLFSWHYPEIVPKDQLDDFIFGAQIHEMGEITTGDTVDDGARDEVKKEVFETFEIRNYLHLTAPKEEAERGIRIFKEMQDKETDFGKTLFFFDKLEAVLQTIFYESMGYPGRLSYKENHYGGISERDKRQRDFTGSDRIADTWSYGFSRRVDKLNFQHADVFKAVVHAAIIDVRKKPFSWID